MEYIEIKEQIKQKLPVARDLGDSGFIRFIDGKSYP